MPDDTVAVQLTPDEALVLFALCTRFTNDDAFTIEHPGEQAALWNLCALLETVLVEPFKEDYPELLAAARGRLAQQAQ